MKHVIMPLIVSALVTGGGLYYYHQHYSVKLAVMDISGYADQLRDEYVQGHLTKQSLDKKLKDLNLRLKTEYQNTVVFLKKAVISGNIQEIDPSR